jgi:hypothetical protein
MIQSADKATEQFNVVIHALVMAARKCWSDRIQELIEVGPEEQNRRDSIRRQESLEDLHLYFKGRRELRVEACIRAGGNPDEIDHEALDRANGRG